jgi:hypothetical protein
MYTDNPALFHPGAQGQSTGDTASSAHSAAPGPTPEVTVEAPPEPPRSLFDDMPMPELHMGELVGGVVDMPSSIDEPLPPPSQSPPPPPPPKQGEVPSSSAVPDKAKKSGLFGGLFSKKKDEDSASPSQKSQKPQEATPPPGEETAPGPGEDLVIDYGVYAEPARVEQDFTNMFARYVQDTSTLESSVQSQYQPTEPQAADPAPTPPPPAETAQDTGTSTTPVGQALMANKVIMPEITSQILSPHLPPILRAHAGAAEAGPKAEEDAAGSSSGSPRSPRGGKGRGVGRSTNRLLNIMGKGKKPMTNLADAGVWSPSTPASGGDDDKWDAESVDGTVMTSYTTATTFTSGGTPSSPRAGGARPKEALSLTSLLMQDMAPAKGRIEEEGEEDGERPSMLPSFKPATDTSPKPKKVRVARTPIKTRVNIEQLEVAVPLQPDT